MGRIGELKTLADWAIGSNETDGFRMLIERGMPELTGEAIVLRHTQEFEPDVITAARERLERAGVDVDQVI